MYDADYIKYYSPEEQRDDELIHYPYTINT